MLWSWPWKCWLSTICVSVAEIRLHAVQCPAAVRTEHVHHAHLLAPSSIPCEGPCFKQRRQTMLKGRSVPFYRWGTVIQTEEFISNFLNTQVFAYLCSTSVTLGLGGFSGLCISYNTLLPQYLFSLILHLPQESISRQTFEHAGDALWSCMGPVTDWSCQTGWIISRCTKKSFSAVARVDDINMMFCEILTT